MDWLASLPVDVQSNSDFVHDVTYNFYGDRIAMCTTAQKIMIWNKVSGDSKAQDCDYEDSWTLSGVITEAHKGPIWRLDWAPPQFGQVLVSCGEDRVIQIWKEASLRGVASTSPPPLPLSRGVSQSPSRSFNLETPSLSMSPWKKRATLTDSPSAVTDVQFAPKKFGLKLASCTQDGLVRVYECTDYLNLNTWEMDDFRAMPTRREGGCTAVSWGLGHADVERLAVSSFDGLIRVFDCIQPQAGPAHRKQWILRASVQISSCPEGSPSAPLPVKDVAWAPSLCRPYDLLAACDEGGQVGIFRFSEGGQVQGEDVGGGAALVPEQVLCPSAKFSSSAISPIWRVAWNITGSLLAVAPESGSVSLWQQDHSLKWVPVHSD